MAKDTEETVVMIKLSKVKGEFVPQTGDSNSVKSEKCLEVTAKVFEFISKSKEEECPNLSP